MMRLSTLAFALFTASTAVAFQRAPFIVTTRPASQLLATEKSYGPGASSPLKDLIDSEGAMKEFFESNEEWWPLFRSVTQSASAPSMSFLGGTHGEAIDINEEAAPWEELQQQPSDEKDRNVLAAFLDAMQQSLLDIPVDEAVEDDDNDLHFLEEGRRMLALNRFHVLSDNSGGSIENFDELFRTVWSELALLTQSDEEGTGSLIVVPDYDLADLRRFTDMNLQRPLEWLGLEDRFEISSLERESPAIRLIHKLQDMPTDAYLEELEVEAAAQYEAEKAAEEAAAKENNESSE